MASTTAPANTRTQFRNQGTVRNPEDTVFLYISMAGFMVVFAVGFFLLFGPLISAILQAFVSVVRDLVCCIARWIPLTFTLYWCYRMFKYTGKIEGPTLEVIFTPIFYTKYFLGYYKVVPATPSEQKETKDTENLDSCPIKEYLTIALFKAKLTWEYLALLTIRYCPLPKEEPGPIFDESVPEPPKLTKEEWKLKCIKIWRKIEVINSTIETLRGFEESPPAEELVQSLVGLRKRLLSSLDSLQASQVDREKPIYSSSGEQKFRKHMESFPQWVEGRAASKPQGIKDSPSDLDIAQSHSTILDRMFGVVCESFISRPEDSNSCVNCLRPKSQHEPEKPFIPDPPSIKAQGRELPSIVKENAFSKVVSGCHTFPILKAEHSIHKEDYSSATPQEDCGLVTPVNIESLPMSKDDVVGMISRLGQVKTQWLIKLKKMEEEEMANKEKEAEKKIEDSFKELEEASKKGQ